MTQTSLTFECDMVDYGGYNRSQFIVQIKDAVGYILGLNRGAVKDSFIEKASECVQRHWPYMVKSDLRRFAEADEFIKTTSSRKHTEVSLAFADLLATMVHDGYPDYLPTDTG